jgi:hypothetical protein
MRSLSEEYDLMKEFGVFDPENRDCVVYPPLGDTMVECYKLMKKYRYFKPEILWSPVYKYQNLYRWFRDYQNYGNFLPSYPEYLI